MQFRSFKATLISSFFIGSWWCLGWLLLCILQSSASFWYLAVEFVTHKGWFSCGL